MFNARKLGERALAADARLVGATPMFAWIGEDDATVFSAEYRRARNAES